MSDAPQIIDQKGKFIKLGKREIAQFDDAKRAQYHRVGEALAQAETTDAELVAAQDRVVVAARALEAAQSRVPKVTHTDIARAWIKQQAADAQR
jgi:hypothetical protein